MAEPGPAARVCVSPIILDVMLAPPLYAGNFQTSAFKNNGIMGIVLTAKTLKPLQQAPDSIVPAGLKAEALGITNTFRGGIMGMHVRDDTRRKGRRHRCSVGIGDVPCRETFCSTHMFSRITANDSARPEIVLQKLLIYAWGSVDL